MRTRRANPTAIAICLLGAGPAFAAGMPGQQVAAIVGLSIPAAWVVVQFVVAVLLPRFTMRTQRAVAEGFWPAAGWGAMLTVLAAAVGAILARGGPPGQTLAAMEGVAAGLLALAGGVGISKILGDWALRRWNAEAPGPLSVLCGGVVWAVGVAVPIVGWAVGVCCIFASLGAAFLVVLNPRTFDPPEPAHVPLAAESSPEPEAGDPAPP